ncbi:MAG: isoprenyl transferase [Deltaproteobacteria bacterium]|nr:isoprenyl transferase [Deltaproteobacteria bacterium]
METSPLIKEKIPRHIAIIMDGNGRWAKQRSLPRVIGHRRGIESVRKIVRACRNLGVDVLSLYAFSTENWNRPPTEIKALMALLKRYIRSEISELHKNDIRFNAIGDVQQLPEDVLNLLRQGSELTKNNTTMILNVALSYSGRSEIVSAVKTIVGKAGAGQLEARDVDEDLIAAHLYTQGMPDPDLLIRTSGELRISNFLLWQIAYSEIYITDVLWPDFREPHLHEALLDYQNRKRRFGLTDDQIQPAR